MTIHISQAMAAYITKTFNVSLSDFAKNSETLESATIWLESTAKTSADPTFMPVSSDSIFLIKNYGNDLPLVLCFIDPKTLKPCGHLVIPALETLTSNQLHTLLDIL